jgi:hypothetical protein
MFPSILFFTTPFVSIGYLAFLVYFMIWPFPNSLVLTRVGNLSSPSVLVATSTTVSKEALFLLYLLPAMGDVLYSIAIYFRYLGPYQAVPLESSKTHRRVPLKEYRFALLFLHRLIGYPIMYMALIHHHVDSQFVSSILCLSSALFYSILLFLGQVALYMIGSTPTKIRMEPVHVLFGGLLVLFTTATLFFMAFPLRYSTSLLSIFFWVEVSVATATHLGGVLCILIWWCKGAKHAENSTIYRFYYLSQPIQHVVYMVFTGLFFVFWREASQLE